jgi:hypothetical protein
MNKNFLKIYLLVMTVFSFFVVFSMPSPFTMIIFSGIFIVNIFLFLDILKKE